ncbi:unnamed protein product [Polarella glacialis]|uniref:Acyl-coenzyme A oxidase n=1 Tax=Polarella glacialis TaxID=89957 RepID=A0A813GFR8_POLGL|nr:unnamed protein product [Polarella glacialis]
MKWWPTAMYCCTHAAVMANLILDGENLGFHGFMVQLRDENGSCMPGIEIGEIGPKINAESTNIGFSRFTHVRVPRFNLFARAQQLTPDGKYIKPASKALSKFKYISMMQIRVEFVSASYDFLAKAATIAIRYSCVRKQGYKRNDRPEEGENVVLDYQMQQYRLFKALSLAYMFYWNARYIRDYLGRIQQGMMEGDEKASEEVPELHATLCGFKVFAAVTAQANMEELRRVRGGKPATGMAAYLVGKPLTLPKVGEAAFPGFRGPTGRKLLVELLQDRARRLAVKLEGAFTAAEQLQPGRTFEEALNCCAVSAWRAAEAHAFYAFAANNLSSLQAYVKDPSVGKALERLFELMALQVISEKGADFAGVLGEPHFDLILKSIEELLAEIRPDAVALVDGFGYLDRHLHSTLGLYDGNVYEAIYEEAKKSPLNQSETMLGWEQLAKIVDLGMLRDGRKEQHAGVSVSSASRL